MRLAAVLLILTIGAGASLYGWGYSQFNSSGPLSQSVTILLPRGTGLRQIAERLHLTGVIRHPPGFSLAARLSGRSRALKAGEYTFSAGISPRGVMAKLIRGDTVVHRLTVAEGLVTAQILELVINAEGLHGPLADIGDKKPKEGELLPETYHFSRGDSRAGVIRRMAGNMEQVLAAAWRSRASGLPLKNPREALILASIVERETALAEERPHIAGVFVNRLRQGMRLQSDPTVAYGISPTAPLGWPLSRQDLKNPHPYNTYVHKGLPPGPIANPGQAAIEAVLHPMATKDLYFVADGGGGHVFASSLAAHNRNVAKWRKLKR